MDWVRVATVLLCCFLSGLSTVVRAANDDGTVSLLIVMDRSGSMDDRRRGTRPIKRARQSVVMVAEMMEPQDQLGLVVFNDSAGVTVPLGVGNSQLVADKARVMRAKGGTSFNAGLRKAAQTITDNGAYGVQVIFISDGDDPKRISSRYVEALRAMGVQVHTIATGRSANKRKLCRLAGMFDGWCVAVRHDGLKATVAQMVEEARGRRIIADIRDVIRPEESQKFEVDVSSAGESLQLSATWTGGDLSFHVTSPSGDHYSTEEPASAEYAAGRATDAFHILRMPGESGTWRFEAEAKDVQSMGEAYRITVTAKNQGRFRLMPLSDSHSAGASVDITIAGCEAAVQASLYEGEEVTQTIDFAPGIDGTCTGTLVAPGRTGLFPVAIDPEGESRLWTTLTVGGVKEVVGSRDQWRPETQPWAIAGTSAWVVAAVVGGGLLFGMFVLVGIVVVIILVRRSSGEGETQMAPREAAVIPADGEAAPSSASELPPPQSPPSEET